MALCSMDDGNEAVCSCFCAFPLPALCEEHLSKHQTDREDSLHFHLPVSARDWIASEEAKDHYFMWVTKLHRAHTRLRGYAKEFDAFEEQLEAAKQEVLFKLEDCCREVRERLCQLKTAFEEQTASAIRDTSIHALDYTWSPEPHSLSEFIWYYDVTNPAKLLHFGATANSPLEVFLDATVPLLAHFNLSRTLLGEAEQNTLRKEVEELRNANAKLRDENERLRTKSDTEIQSLTVRLAELKEQASVTSPQVFLARVSAREVCFLSTKPTWGIGIQISKKIKVDSGTSFMLLDENRLFCCGNGNASSSHKETYLLQPAGGQISVSALPALKHMRDRPGLFHFEGELFVFGSAFKESQRSVEVLRFPAQNWTLLEGRMSANRWFFTPCEYERKAYLCRAAPESIDVFDLTTLTFTHPLNVDLPDDRAAVSVIVGSEIIIFSNEHTTTVDIKKGTSAIREHRFVNVAPLSTPVVCEGWIYWVRDDGKCIKARGVTLEELG